jgi:hypothetical protein
MLFFRGGLLILVAMAGWIAFYQAASTYLSLIVTPRAVPPRLLEICFWVAVLLACGLARFRLRRGLGASIAAYRRASSLRQKLLIATAKISFAAGIFALLGLLFPLWSKVIGLHQRPWTWDEALCWVALLSLAEPINRILNPIMVAKLLPAADKVLKDDPRSPVVYLRAFDAELSRATPERRLLRDVPQLVRNPRGLGQGSLGMQAPPRSLQRAALAAMSGRGQLDEQAAFATVMTLIGPYVAIGRPSEGTEYGGVDIGAAKIYVADDEWQNVVAKWLQTAAVVVIEVGPTKGLLWELNYAMHQVEKTRILLVLPSDDTDYRDFCALTVAIFPHPLPEQRPVSRLLALDPDGRPLQIASSGQLQFTLAPFFERLGFVVPDVIELPKELHATIRELVVRDHAFGVSEYIANLIKEDHRRRNSEEAHTVAQNVGELS